MKGRVLLALIPICIMLILLVCCSKKKSSEKSANKDVIYESSISDSQEATDLPGFLSAAELKYIDTNVFYRNENICKENKVSTVKFYAGETITINNIEYILRIYDIAYLSGSGELSNIYEILLTKSGESDTTDEIIYRKLIEGEQFKQKKIALPFAIHVDCNQNNEYWLVYDGNNTHVLLNDKPVGLYKGIPSEVSLNSFVLEHYENIAGQKIICIPYTFAADCCIQSSTEFDVKADINAINSDSVQEEGYHTALIDFHAYACNSQDTKETVLIQKGTKLVITKTDLINKVYFITNQNIRCYFEYAFNSDCQDKKIDGKPEKSVLSNLNH